MFNVFDSIAVKYYHSLYFFRLGKGASVARSPGIPQPNGSVPTTGYHDIDLWAVFHATNRGVV